MELSILMDLTDSDGIKVISLAGIVLGWGDCRRRKATDLTDDKRNSSLVEVDGMTLICSTQRGYSWRSKKHFTNTFFKRDL